MTLFACHVSRFRGAQRIIAQFENDGKLHTVSAVIAEDGSLQHGSVDGVPCYLTWIVKDALSRCIEEQKNA